MPLKGAAALALLTFIATAQETPPQLQEPDPFAGVTEAKQQPAGPPRAMMTSQFFC